MRGEECERGFSVHATHIVILGGDIKVAERGAEKRCVHGLYVEAIWRGNEREC